MLDVTGGGLADEGKTRTEMPSPFATALASLRVPAQGGSSSCGSPAVNQPASFAFDTSAPSDEASTAAPDFRIAASERSAPPPLPRNNACEVSEKSTARERRVEL